MCCLDIELQTGGQESKAGGRAMDLWERQSTGSCKPPVEYKKGRWKRLLEANYFLEDTNTILAVLFRSTGLKVTLSWVLSPVLSTLSSAMSENLRFSESTFPLSKSGLNHTYHNLQIK